MSDIEKIQLFENKKIRTVWVEKEEKWYFAVEDVIEVLTDSRDPKQYVKRMKLRDSELAKGWVQIVPLLTVMTEGGPQKMRCANLQGMFRIIQSIPSKKAEPIKVWMAQVAAERINQAIDPERSERRRRSCEIGTQRGRETTWAQRGFTGEGHRPDSISRRTSLLQAR